MLVILLTLGFWQIERLKWKTGLIRELEIRAAAKPIPLPTDPRIAPADLANRRVKVTGHYMYETELHLLNRVRKGVPGLNIITPLVRDDGGGTVLVNRGWVPMDWPGTPIEEQGAEPIPIEVTGIVRIPRRPGWMTPKNEPAKNDWYYVDLTAMSQAAGTLANTDYYIYATGEHVLSDTPAPFLAPDPNVWHIDLPNNHLSYAITWFSLAGVLMVIYLVYHTKRQEPDDG
jgi:surfeit locus 1 family protein